MESLRSNVSLATPIGPESLGLEIPLPSLATGLVNTIVVAADFETLNVVTSFRCDFTIVHMPPLASNFGLQLYGGSPQNYEGHNIWDVDGASAILALAVADETTGVAAAGQNTTASKTGGLIRASLYAFDRRSAGLVDTPGLNSTT